MSQAGRPSKLSDPKFRSEFLSLAASGHHPSVIGRYLGVDRSGLKLWRSNAASGMEPYQSFINDLDAAVAKSEISALSLLEQCALKCARKGDSRDLWKFLERRFPQRWAPKPPPEKKTSGPSDFSIDLSMDPEESPSPPPAEG